jgi:DNA-binding transcriptional ArsR family regulator
MLNKLIVDLIQDAVMGDEAYEVHGSVLSVGYDVLKELGLVREDREGELGATPRLIRIFVEVYYYRRADEIIKGKYPAVPHDRRRGALLFAPLVRPKQPL